MAAYPAELGYFSDCPSALDLLDAGYATLGPFETSSQARLLAWLRDPVVGARLQTALLAADSDEAARQLSAAFDLWEVCARLG